MKILKYLILGILLLYFQIMIAPKFALYGIIPNFSLAYLIYLNIRLDRKIALPIAFLLGLALDLTYPSLLGMNTFAFIIVSLIINSYHENINKRRFIIVILGITVVNIVYYSFFILYHITSSLILPRFFLLAIYAVVYNTIFTTITLYFFIIVEKIRLTVNV
jgi:rod shape-determining protein MreD